MTGLYMMLSPKTASVDSVGGGIPVITCQEVCAAISFLKLSDFETAYLRARLIDGEQWGDMSTALAIMGWIHASAISSANGWKLRRGEEQLRKAMFLVMNERICPDTVRCQACRGRGLILREKEKKYIECIRCEKSIVDKHTGQKIGNGRRKISDRSYAKFIGVDKNTYALTWANRLKILRKFLIEIERKGRYLPGVFWDDDDAV